MALLRFMAWFTAHQDMHGATAEYCVECYLQASAPVSPKLLKSAQICYNTIILHLHTLHLQYSSNHHVFCLSSLHSFLPPSSIPPPSFLPSLPPSFLPFSPFHLPSFLRFFSSFLPPSLPPSLLSILPPSLPPSFLPPPSLLPVFFPSILP